MLDDPVEYEYCLGYVADGVVYADGSIGSLERVSAEMAYHKIAYPAMAELQNKIVRRPKLKWEVYE